MTDVDALAKTFAAIVVEGSSAAPARICAACVADLPVDGAAITLMGTAHQEERIYASDEIAARLNELQFSLGEGPCIEAFTLGRPVLVTDLTDLTDQRWPIFAAEARRTSAQALYAFPLQAGVISAGVLNFYRLDPGLFTSAQMAGALLAADAALWTLLDRKSLTRITDVDQDGWLTGSPLHRAEVYQATGMVMTYLGVNAETALARLRGFAFAHNRPLGEVAHEVVTRRLRFGEEEI